MLELNLIFVHENVFIRFPKLLESKKAIPPNWAAQSDENEVLSREYCAPKPKESHDLHVVGISAWLKGQVPTLITFYYQESGVNYFVLADRTFRFKALPCPKDDPPPRTLKYVVHGALMGKRRTSWTLALTEAQGGAYPVHDYG
jgi:hypothetical protein